MNGATSRATFARKATCYVESNGRVRGEDRGPGTLLPELFDDYVADDNPVRVVDVFAEELHVAAETIRALREIGALNTCV